LNVFPKLEELAALPWFGQEQEAYRLAVAVALARGFSPSVSDTGGFQTKFNTGSLDSDRRLRDFVLALAGEQCQGRPYDYAQRLAVAGINYLYQRLVEQEEPLSEVLGLLDGGVGDPEEEEQAER
jgi:hypothetical protein